MFAEAKVLHQYTVRYYKCNRCRFVFTEAPYWLAEAYRHPISIHGDTGMLHRNEVMREITRALLDVYFNRKDRCLDFGGGYGVFTRMMRNYGYAFDHYDPYCENLFAPQYSASLGAVRYRLITAFEVFEHFVDPAAEVERLFTLSDHVLFTTSLLPPHSPKPGQWRYYAAEWGQHISLYAYESLEALARRLGLKLYSNRRSIHLLTRGGDYRMFELLCQPNVARTFNFYMGQESPLEDAFR